MQVYFNGAENPGWRNKLIDWGAKSLAINFKHLAPRLPKKSKFLIAERFPEDIDVIVHCEIPSGDIELLDLYQQWCDDNADRLRFAVEPNGDEPVGKDRMADAAWIPLWRPESGHRTLQRLADMYAGVAVAQSAWDVEKPVSARINRLVTGQQTYVHGLGVAKLDLLTSVAFGSVSIGSWLSAAKYGETQVWDGSQLHRFPAETKEARQRYRSHIARSGIDVDAVMADDPDAVCRLAVWSWQQLEDYLSRRRDVPTDIDVARIVTSNDDDAHEADIEESSDTARDTTSSKRGTLARTRERKLLPILGVEEISSDDGEERTTLTRIGIDSVRSCDACQLSDVCPSYEAGSSCAFHIPVRLRTKDELLGLVSGLCEMQAQRVLFARFREDLEGSNDAGVSIEIDRLMRMTEQLKEMAEGSETLELRLRAHGGAGILSRVFGAQVGEAQRALPGGGVDEGGTRRIVSEVLDMAPEDAVEVPSTTSS